jgi:hypothetical protein
LTDAYTGPDPYSDDDEESDDYVDSYYDYDDTLECGCCACCGCDCDYFYGDDDFYDELDD